MNNTDLNIAREKFLYCCKTYIKRPGLDSLLEYLEQKTDFFHAPSSVSYHLNEEGGLVQHAVNVFECALTIYDQVIQPAIQKGTSPFTEEVDIESIAVSALFHDVCKTNIYKKKQKWRKDEYNHWESYDGYEIEDNFPFGHGEKSCLIISTFMKLKQCELLAIRWHMGMFEMTDVGSNGRFAYRAAMEKSPLVALLQAADMLSANCLEKTSIPPATAHH